MGTLALLAASNLPGNFDMQMLAQIFSRKPTFSGPDVESFVLLSTAYQPISGSSEEDSATLASEDNRKEFHYETPYDEEEDSHLGLHFPTEEEKVTLRHVADDIPWNVYLISVIEMSERFSYYGSSVVFVNFIQQPLPPESRTGAGLAGGQSGALGFGQQTSTAIRTLYSLWCYLVTLVGAYIADTYWGRFKTISVAIWVSVTGHIILIVSALPMVIVKPYLSITIFVIALVAIGLGTGGFKANISPLVAEQYKKTKLFVVTKKDGERVIVDPGLTTNRIYMNFLLLTCIGTLAGQISMTLAEKYVGFWLAFTFPTFALLICPVVLVAGRSRYTHAPPSGKSELVTAFRLWSFAARSKWSLNPFCAWRRLRAPGFWEDAKPSHQSPLTRPTWMTFDDSWVEEVRSGVNACTIFCWFPIYALMYNQIGNFTSQAATMNTHGLPNDIFNNINSVFLIFMIPICDRIVFPFLRRVRLISTPLKKITFGFACACGSMAWAAYIQYLVYEKNPCHSFASTCVDDSGHTLITPLSVWIQIPIYGFMASSEIFAHVTGLEYAYTNAPKNMRSIVMSAFYFTNAISSALSEAFVSLAHDPLLVWNYSVIAILVGGATILFWLSVRSVDAQDASEERCTGAIEVA